MSPPRKKEKKEEVTKLPGDETASGLIRFELPSSRVSFWSAPFHKFIHGLSKPRLEVLGNQWWLSVSKRDGLVDVILHKHHNNDSELWSADVSAEFIVINADEEKNWIGKFSKTYYHNKSESGGIRKFIEWEKIIDKEQGFIKDDKLTIEVRFSLSNIEGIRSFPLIDFTDPNEPCHDVALVVEGEKIYVNKQYLALHSPVFNTLFNGDFTEKDKKEIELKDVDREEFLGLLSVIYHPDKNITAQSAEYLLKLGNRFLIECVIEHSKSILSDPNNFPPLDRPRIAKTLKLYGLKTNVGLVSGVDFADPTESGHDVALLIEGEKIYVNKQILAIHSPVFKTMFYGESAEKDKKEIELKDIDRTEFIEMLNFIYQSNKIMTETNVEFLLKLADRFQIKKIIDRAILFLTQSDEMEIARQLVLSDQHRLVMLQDHCFNELETVEDVKDLMATRDYEELSDNTKASLLEIVMKLI